ncbi:replication protein P [Pseudomonas sp.]|jgi:hypothetical protein|uniref:replication protein P n=1 Tax=Pseudomonas sp. TaxID=306 RepID=UPI002ED7CFC6
MSSQDLTTTSTAKLSVLNKPHASLGMSPMDWLFNRLDGAYMTKWRREFPSEQAVANWRESWAEGLEEERITLAEIKRGVAQCRKLFDWPPSLTEFLKACRPALNAEVAFAEAVKQMNRRKFLMGTALRPGETVQQDEWTHPAIYWAALELGKDLFDYEFKDLQIRWRSALDQALASPKGAVPPPMLALPAPQLTEEERQAQIVRGQEQMGRIRSITRGVMNGIKPKTARKFLRDDQLEQKKKEMAEALAELQARGAITA